ncbi:MAG: hypothetical protein JOZ78_15485 [Chroococcidiopsidaceae cyanobacterium CP_BM_ER_R8_30]|nr:hypothetical protein [Chroococcidiopsidaceae cyanobacterium CP_BM_ER_R8_30]
MKRTVYIPDELDHEIEKYLADHQEESLSSIIQEAIQKKIAKRNVEAFLSMAGIVKDAPFDSSQKPEDIVIFHPNYVP